MLLPVVLAHVPGMPGTDSGRYLRGYQEAGNHCSEPYTVLSNLAIIPGSWGKVRSSTGEQGPRPVALAQAVTYHYFNYRSLPSAEREYC